MKNILIKKINQSLWWHVTPRDANAYKKRGKFLASTYKQAEFYGRPNDIPEKVKIQNPVFGFSEFEILKQLFSEKIARDFLNQIETSENFYETRIQLDSIMYQRAKELGYDCIVLMTEKGKKALLSNKKPLSIELNLIV